MPGREGRAARLAAGCEEALPHGAGRGGQCGWGRQRDEGRLPPPSLPPRGGLAGVVTLTCHSFFSSAGLRGAATGQRACPRGREVGGSEPAHPAWVLGGLSCWTVSSDHRGVPGGGRGPAPPAPAGSSCLPAMRWSLTHSPCRPPRHSYRPAEGCGGELGGQHVEQGLQGDGAGAGVSLHIRFSHVPVVLVPLCLRGQMRLCASDGHTSWLLVWRVQCPLLWQSGPGAPHRAGVWVLFQEPARSHPALTPAQESSNKSPCAHVCPGVWTLSWGVPLAPLTLAPWPGDT